jgi:hypothetical protein
MQREAGDEMRKNSQRRKDRDVGLFGEAFVFDRFRDTSLLNV